MVPKSNPVTWFEIPVGDLARGKAFYEHVFGLQLAMQDFGPLQMAWFPLAQGASGATGSLVKAETYLPSHAGTMVYFEVEDIEMALKRVTEMGGHVIRGKTSIGQFGYVGHFEDCEGNRVALHSMS